MPCARTERQRGAATPGRRRAAAERRPQPTRIREAAPALPLARCFSGASSTTASRVPGARNRPLVSRCRHAAR
eukprot:scaffold204_cov113-Isochrysis_galbana.AAC.4